MPLSDAEISIAHGVLRVAVKEGADAFAIDPSFGAEAMRELRERRLRDKVKAGEISDQAAALQLVMINANPK